MSLFYRDKKNKNKNISDGPRAILMPTIHLGAGAEVVAGVFDRMPEEVESLEAPNIYINTRK